MNRYYLSLFLSFLVFCTTSTFAQSLSDSLNTESLMKESIDSISYEIKDTARARELLQEGKALAKEQKFDEALAKFEIAKNIYKKTVGENSLSFLKVIFSVGTVYFLTSQFEKANQLFDIFISQPPQVNQVEIYGYYELQGHVYFLKRNYKKSIESFQESLTARLMQFDSIDASVSDNYAWLGSSYYKIGEFNSAMVFFKKSLKIKEQIYGTESIFLDELVQRIGIVYLSNGQYDEAIKYLDKTLELKIKKYGGNHLETAIALNNIGVYHYFKGNYKMAARYYEEALEIRQKKLGEENLDVIETLENIGICYRDRGDYNHAIIIFSKVLKARQKLLESNHPKLALTYNNLGLCYQEKGDLGKSLDFFQEAVKIWSTEDVPQNIAYAYNNIGNTYSFLGYHDKAIPYLEKSLLIWKKIQGDSHPDVAIVLSNLGAIEGKIGNTDNALILLEEALKIWRHTLGVEHSKVAIALREIGEIYLEMGQNDTAMGLFEKAKEIQLKTLGLKHPNLSETYLKMAIALTKQKKNIVALEYFEKALYALNFDRLDSLTSVNSIPGLLNVLENKATFLRTCYSPEFHFAYLEQSRTAYNEALNVSDYQFKTLSVSSQSTLLGQITPIYDGALQTNRYLYSASDSLHYQEESFDLAERSKSLLLNESIKESKALDFSGIHDSILQKEYNLRVDITFYEKKRQEIRNEGLTETDSTVMNISSILFSLRRQYEALKDTLETRYPDYYRLKYDLSTVALDYVQDTLLRPGQTLLEYFTGDSAIYIFVVRPDTFHVVEVKKDFPLEDWVKHLRHGLTDYHVKNSKSPVYLDSTAREYVAAASDLYQKLIAPVAGLLDSTVVIVPDGVLGYVPFDVLLSEKPTVPTRFHSHAYLGKQKRISYAYSATLLREMRDKRHKKQPTESLLALAPFFRGDVKQLHEQVDTLSDLLSLRRDSLAALPASGREAVVVAKIYDGKALLGDASPKEILQQEAGHYRILHLSTHGKADDKVGDYAYLGFAMPGDALAFDKFYAKDIYNLALNADLVTLSACETGIGELKRGEGIISLARAFAYAGAKSIVTTLWSVNDTRTGELMEGFYKNLYKGMDKDAALWQAKKDFIAAHKKDAAHPYFWAGFIPIGDMRAIPKN